MGLHRLFSVSPAVNYVAPSHVSMVSSLLVTSGLVMLSRFPVMACGMRDVLMISCDVLQLSLTCDLLRLVLRRQDYPSR